MGNLIMFLNRLGAKAVTSTLGCNDSRIYEIDWIATDKGTEGIHIPDKPTLDVWDSLTDDEKDEVRKIARKVMGY
jgi:hypothetical protein